MTLRDALDAAGGFTSLAASSAIRLERVGQSPRTLDTKVEEQAMTPLQAGDRLIIATMGVRRYVTVTGGVRVPGSVEYVPGLTLLEAVQKCGGLVGNARPKETKIISPQGESQTINLELIASGYMADVPLDPNAKVEIPGGVVRSGGGNNRALVTAAFGILLFLLFGQ
jgi:protein involved in polysaccharide export with SLBB domain